MRILALDLAKDTGWATHEIVRGVEVTHCGTTRLVTGAITTNMTEAEQQLRNLIIAKAPDAIIIEGTIYRHANATYSAVSLRREVERWAEKHGVPVIAVPPRAAKKHLTGNGNAKKDDMLAAARALYPQLNIEDHNAADALAVLSLGLERAEETEREAL